MASRGVNLSAIQVSAGILATLTGAIAASFLGVGGTLVGAAVGSIASTVGGEVYKHYLERTHERLRGAVDVRRYRTAQSTVGPVDPAVAQNRLGVTSRRQEDDADGAETQVLQVPPPGAPGQGAVTTPRTTSPNDPMGNSPTETFAAGNGRGHGQRRARQKRQGEEAALAGADGDHRGDVPRRRGRDHRDRAVGGEESARDRHQPVRGRDERRRRRGQPEHEPHHAGHQTGPFRHAVLDTIRVSLVKRVGLAHSVV
jgi:hypothetical protein